MREHPEPNSSGCERFAESSPELGVPAVNRTDVIEFDFSAQIFLKPFEQEPTAAEQLTRSAALWLPWATACPITRTATRGRASVMLGQLSRCASSRPR